VLTQTVVAPPSVLGATAHLHLKGQHRFFASSKSVNGLYAQLHYLLYFSQLLVSCLQLLGKLINSGVLDLSSHGNNNQTHLN